MIGECTKMYKKHMPLFKFGYMINDNENKADIEKKNTQKRHK